MGDEPIALDFYKVWEGHFTMMTADQMLSNFTLWSHYHHHHHYYDYSTFIYAVVQYIYK